jgi:hypothetical protein
MIARCTNPDHDGFANYGGRGITVCDEWKFYEGFYRDMGERPRGLTIERVNNELGYSKENCRWATIVEQSRNKRNNIILTSGGRSMLLIDWAAEIGVDAKTLYRRVKVGWSDEAVLAPLCGKRRGIPRGAAIHNWEPKTEADRALYAAHPDVNQNLVRTRLKRGWPLEKAISKPANKYTRKCADAAKERAA